MTPAVANAGTGGQRGRPGAVPDVPTGWFPQARELGRAEKLGRWLTAGLRLMPDFLIIGGQRCGTTSLFRYLERHPGVVAPLKKEIHFFDDGFGKGVRWYRSHFPLRSVKDVARPRRWVTGEASPYYLMHPLAPQRVRDLLPDVKLIVLLRNPVDRAHSHYHHNVRKGVETLAFEEAIEAERGRLEGEAERIVGGTTDMSFSHRRHSYVTRGIYVDQLRVWMRLFPAHHWLVLKSEDFNSEPATALRQVAAHLDLPEWRPPEFPRYHHQEYTAMRPDTRQRLLEFFEPHNLRLSEYLGRDFGWTR